MANHLSPSTLKFYLFGSFEVLLDGQKIHENLWHSRQVRSVLKVLVARRGKVTTSEQLIDILWPNDDPEAALKRLYVRVSQLRKILKCDPTFSPIQHVPGGYLFTDAFSQPGAEESIDHTIWVDVAVFEAAADQGNHFLEQKQLTHAVQAFELARQLYRGEFLAEDPYEEWTIAERVRLKERYLVVLTELAEVYAQQGYFRRSINLCQQILSLDPWREAVFVHLMLYYYYAGDRVKALQTYDQCQQALKDQVGIDPAPHTAWLAQSIQEGTLWTQTGEAAYPPPAFEGRMFEVPYSLGETPFTGRDRELAWLLAGWRSNSQGCLWISGEAGIGKTYLANAFVHVVKNEGVQVIKLTAPRTPSDLYEALFDGLDIPENSSTLTNLSINNRNLLNQLSEGDHVFQPGVDLPEGNWRHDKNITDALIEFILAKQTPILICVDDVHVLDEESVKILADLIGKVGFLLTSRQGEIGEEHPFLQLTKQFEPSIRARVLSLWGVEDVRKLVITLGGEEISSIAADLHVRSQGNPLFIIASLQHLFEEGFLYVTPDGRWAQSGPFGDAIAPSIHALIAQRLNLVQADERQILDVLAVAGGTADYELLQSVLERKESALLASVDQLISKGLVLEPRDYESADLTLAHGLYGEVLYATLPKARQRIYHRRIAETMLATTGRDGAIHASSIARHFYQAGAALQGSRYARMAGDHALRIYAPEEALLHYQDALSWVADLEFDDKSEFVSQVQLGMAEAERFLGNYPQAGDLYRQALPSLSGAFKEVAIFQLFNIQLLQGEPLSVYEGLAAEYEHLLVEEGDSWALALFYWSKSFVALMRGDAGETRLQQVGGWRVARRLYGQGKQPPHWIHQRAYSILMRAHNQWGNYAVSIHFAGRVLSACPPSEIIPNTRAVVDASLGDSFTFMGQFTRAEESYQQCYGLAQAAHDPRLMAVALLGLGQVSLMRGEFEPAADYAQQVLAMTDPPADILRQLLAQYLLVCIAVKTGLEPEHFASMENILNFTRYIGVQPYSVLAMLTLAEMHLSRHKIAQAETYAQEAAQMAERCHLKREKCAALRSLAEVKAQQGDQDSALALVEDALVLARAIDAPYEAGLCLRTRASLHCVPNSAADDAHSAASLFEALGAVYEAGKTRTLLASLNGDTEMGSASGSAS